MNGDNDRPEAIVAEGPVLLDLHADGVAHLRLNRPDCANGLDIDLLKTFHAVVMQVHGDSRVRAVLLTGEGRNFCAGGDVHAFAAKGEALPDYIRMATSYLQIVAALLMRLNAPVVHTARIAARRVYAEAGVAKPREQISMTEVHDCFSITELVTMEDLQLSDEGQAVRDVLDGAFDADGRNPCQIDGGLKCFGHPIGASGIRMLYEMYLQLQGRAGPRRLANPRLGLTHNLGGQPSQNVCSVAIVGLQGA